ncbi:hypothetical protein [uncultured Psychromonas sp.]|uniref:hypothetical protein n=1 Tax=uncultured Psychromonas sp. TaxID=173974 RepID=UPI00260C0DF3|nr:hypothetical protein [uncultured Psychromonas sp.]
MKNKLTLVSLLILSFAFTSQASAYNNNSKNNNNNNNHSMSSHKKSSQHQRYNKKQVTTKKVIHQVVKSNHRPVQHKPTKTIVKIEKSHSPLFTIVLW